MSNDGLCTVCKKPITVTVFRGSPYCSNRCKKSENAPPPETQALICAEMPFTWVNGYATMADVTILADNSITIKATPHPDMIDEFRDLLLGGFSLGVFMAGIAPKYMEEKS